MLGGVGELVAHALSGGRRQWFTARHGAFLACMPTTRTNNLVLTRPRGGLSWFKSLTQVDFLSVVQSDDGQEMGINLRRARRKINRKLTVAYAQHSYWFGGH